MILKSTRGAPPPQKESTVGLKNQDQSARPFTVKVNTTVVLAPGM